MTKNVTRKLLSLVSTLSLGVVGFVGVATPAQADTAALTVAPASGTEFIIPATENFEVKVYYNAGYSAANAANLKLYMTTGGGFNLDATVSTGTSMTVANNNVVGTAEAADEVEIGANLRFVGLHAGDGSDTTTTHTVVVQAFEDADGNGKPGTGEYQSPEYTVTFVKHTDINWTVSHSTALFPAATTVTTYVTSDVNLSQLTFSGTAANTTMAAVRYYDATTTAGTYVAIGSKNMAYSSDDNRLESTSGTVTSALSAGDAVRSDFFFDTSAQTQADWEIAISAGTGVGAVRDGRFTAIASSTTIDAMSSNVLTGATANTTDNGSGTVAVRQGASSFDMYVDVTKSSAAVAGALVTFTIEESTNNSLDSAASISAGGNTLTNTNAGTKQKITATAVSDADGRAKVTVNVSGTKKTNALALTATAQGISASSTTATFTEPDADIARFVGAVGGEAPASATPEVVTAKDATTSLRYSLLDTFGAPITTTGYTLTLTDSTNSKTATANVVNGIATITFPAYAATGSHTLAVSAKAPDGTTDSLTTSEGVELTVGTAKTAALVTLYNGADVTDTVSKLATGSHVNSDYGKTTAITRNEKAWVVADTRLGGSAPAEATAASGVLLSGLVTDNDGAGAVGPVTIAGTGLNFYSDGVFAKDSITVNTDDAGEFSVVVNSNVAGDITATVTAGAVSSTQKFTFATAGDDDATQISITVPQNVTPGSTFQVTGKIMDAFGNGVSADNASGDDENFKVTYSGPGIPFSLPTEAGADGTFSFYVLLSSNLTGTGTVTVSYDQNRDSDYADTKDLVVTQTVTIGAEQKVNAGSFKGYVAVYAKGYEGQRLSAKIGDDWVIVDPIVNNQENGTLFRVTDFTGAGVDIAVRIYIDRVLIDTIALTTK